MGCCACKADLLPTSLQRHCLAVSILLPIPMYTRQTTTPAKRHHCCLPAAWHDNFCILPDSESPEGVVPAFESPPELSDAPCFSRVVTACVPTAWATVPPPDTTPAPRRVTEAAPCACLLLVTDRGTGVAPPEPSVAPWANLDAPLG